MQIYTGCRVDARMSLKQVIRRQAYLCNRWIGIATDAECCDHRGQYACADTLAKSMKFNAIWLKNSLYYSQIDENLRDLAVVNLQSEQW